MLRKDEYIKTVRRLYPPFLGSLQCLGYADGRNFETILTKPFRIGNMAHIDKYWYYSIAELNRAGQMAFSAWRNKDFLEKVKEEFQKRDSELMAAAVTNFDAFYRAYQVYMPAVILFYGVESPTENALREAFRKKISAKETDTLMSGLNIPLENNYYKQEEYDLVTTDNIDAH